MKLVDIVFYAACKRHFDPFTTSPFNACAVTAESKCGNELLWSSNCDEWSQVLLAQNLSLL